MESREQNCHKQNKNQQQNQQNNNQQQNQQNNNQQQNQQNKQQQNKNQQQNQQNNRREEYPGRGTAPRPRGTFLIFSRQGADSLLTGGVPCATLKLPQSRKYA